MLAAVFSLLERIVGVPKFVSSFAYYKAKADGLGRNPYSFSTGTPTQQATFRLRRPDYCLSETPLQVEVHRAG